MRSGISGNKEMENNLKDAIAETLKKENSEYRNNYEQLGRLAVPKILFWMHGHENYFKSGGKQKWVRK